MPRLIAVALLSCSLLAAVPAVATAAPPPTLKVFAQGGGGGGGAVSAGRNLGNIVKSWGSALLLGIAGLMGLAALAKRNLAEGLTLLALVVLIGGFIFADDAVKGFVESLWSSVAG